MKTKMTYTMAGIFTAVILWSGWAMAMPGCLERIDSIKGITLTDAQKTKIQAFDTDHQKKMIKFHADMSIARLEKDNLLKDKNFKKDAVEKQVRKIMAIKTDMELEKVAEINNLRTVLTDDQWKAFTDDTRCPRGRGMMDGMSCPRGEGMRHGGMGRGMKMGMRGDMD